MMAMDSAPDEAEAVTPRMLAPLHEKVSTLVEPGQKRVVSSVSLAEVDGVDEMRAIAQGETDGVLESPESALKSECPDAAGHARPIEEELETVPCAGPGAGPEIEPQGALEAYKVVIDATTQLQACGDEDGSSAEDDESLIAASQTSIEWQDPTTGTTMSYAVCDECSDAEAVTLQMSAEEPNSSTLDTMGLGLCDEGSEETPMPLQVTVEWQAVASGAMLGYAFCDDGDKECQAMHQLFEEQDELTEKPHTCTDALDGSVTTQMSPGPDELNVTSSESQQDWLAACPCDAGPENQSMEPQMGIEATMQMLAQWEDPKTCTMLGYAVCEADSEDLAEAAQIGMEWGYSAVGGEMREGSEEQAMQAMAPQFAAEWEDSTTGVVMGYAYDDDSDMGDHIDEHQALPKAWEGEAGHEAESQAASAHSQDLRREVKMPRGTLKRRFRPLVLRLRDQHMKRVIKSWRKQR